MSTSWCVGSYLHRTDPAACVSGSRETTAWTDTARPPFNGSSVLTTGRRWREGLVVAPPERDSSGVLETQLKVSGGDQEGAQKAGPLPLEILVRKCLYLLGFRDLKTGTGLSAECTSRFEEGAAGMSGVGYVRAGVWNGDGESSAVCFASIQILSALAEVRWWEDGRDMDTFPHSKGNITRCVVWCRVARHWLGRCCQDTSV